MGKLSDKMAGMAGGCLLACGVASAQLSLPETPIFVGIKDTALVQLVLARDNKLFFEAYPSYEDIDGDGEVDIRYKPDEIDYAGYFYPYFCYSLVANSHLTPSSKTADKTCAAGWSGDFLNYLTMSRMDMIRYSLYGGKRVIDQPDHTRLRRAFIPMQNHTWGIEYSSIAIDGYDITRYSPLAMPSSGNQHLFATNNKDMDDIPYLRVREDVASRIYNWVDIEGAQGAGFADRDIPLDVDVCMPDYLEDNCRLYPDGSYKPIGILHEYSDNDTMYFGLLTGSYENNLRGGVLRETMKSFSTNEVDGNSGQFIGAPGIVGSIDAIQIVNSFNGNVQTDCGLLGRTMVNGECSSWGNPVAEMMYEGMRYFAGELSPTSLYDTAGGKDAGLGLQAASWDDPYAPSQPYPECSSAYQLVISDPSPTFDGDDLPGSAFSTFNESTLGSLHVGDLADMIHNEEFGGPGLSFIGESGVDIDKAASPKIVTSFRDIRGISPESPHREGSYYAPSVSYYGHQNDLNPNAPGMQSVGNFTLALGSPVPTIDIDVQGKTISFAPFSRTIGDGNSGTANAFQPTNALVGFIVESLTPTTGSFRVSFEDQEQGHDNDMDALVRYSYVVNGNTVEMTVESIYAAGGFIQHSGYGVSGTTSDGVYLVVRDIDTAAANDVDYFLDVPPGSSPGIGFNDGMALPLSSSITFTVDDSAGITQFESPLWYAAKWGGFDDRNGDGLPQQAEWDADNNGIPDNYFPVTNPSIMRETLREAFEKIDAQSAAGTSIAVTGGALKSGDRIYQSDFLSGQWSGQLRSFPIDADGSVTSGEDWNANDALRTQIADDSRQIITYNPVEDSGVAFRWPSDPMNPGADELSSAQVAALAFSPLTFTSDDKGADRLSHIRGVEISGFRTRQEPLGDIVHASPVIVGPPEYYYPDTWGAGAPENNNPYSLFGRANRTRQRVVYVGANDGMLHAFDAGSYVNSAWTGGTGSEIFAFIPNTVFGKLPDLTLEKYRHKFYVDATPRVGDAYLGNKQWRTVLTGGLRRGGQGIYALDVTDPNSINEANASSAVLWEFSDNDDSDLGYTYSSPLIVRMHNGRWAAVFGNGYNSTESDGNASSTGNSALFVVDLETGNLIRKFLTGEGDLSNPNGMSEPTAIDLDRDNIIDVIYAGDLHGHLWAFDVSSSNPGLWSIVGNDSKFRTTLTDDNPAPITTPVAVGSHPNGEGVMLYVGSGKFLEQGDLDPSSGVHRIFGLWDKDPFAAAGLQTALTGGKLLEQSVTDESTRTVDTDDDGIVDTEFAVRKTSEHKIDWNSHLGWYINLEYGNVSGEQLVAAPILREGRLIVNTLLPKGNPCEPGQDSWFMVFNAGSGAMEESSPLDLDNDGDFSNEEQLTGVRNLGNPLSPAAIASTSPEDVIIHQNPNDPAVSTITLDARLREGRLSWRELEP